MIEGRKPIVFQNISKDNVPAIKNLDRDFKGADFITQAEVKKYAQNIIQRIESETNADQKKIFLIDCLRDDAIFSAIRWSDRDPMTDKMVSDSIKAIKKLIIYELKPYISDKLYLFLQQIIHKNPKHFNKYKIVHDSTFKKSFLKETNFYPEVVKNIREGLKRIKDAIDRLKQAGGSMPYVVNPEIIEDQTNPFDTGSVYYTVNEEDLVNFEDIVHGLNKEFSTIQKVNAIIDCLRGAKFLADNGLTLTDMQIRNIAINKKTGQGILFDLDGLVTTNKKIERVVGPGGPGGYYEPIFFPPEYRRGNRSPWIADSRSMIWEMGDNLKILAGSLDDKEKKLRDKLDEFSAKMMQEKAEDRPSFDECIAELNKIVEENFKNE